MKQLAAANIAGPGQASAEQTPNPPNIVQESIGPVAKPGRGIVDAANDPQLLGAIMSKLAAVKSSLEKQIASQDPSRSSKQGK